jgi:adenylate cyclase
MSLPCCALATPDHDAAAPPSNVMNSRRRMGFPQGQGSRTKFASAVDAARCAIEIQKEMAQRNAVISEDRRLEFRIGINVGDVIIDEGDIYGDGVNIAARVESLVVLAGFVFRKTHTSKSKAS